MTDIKQIKHDQTVKITGLGKIEIEILPSGEIRKNFVSLSKFGNLEAINTDLGKNFFINDEKLEWALNILADFIKDNRRSNPKKWLSELAPGTWVRIGRETFIIMDEGGVLVGDKPLRNATPSDGKWLGAYCTLLNVPLNIRDTQDYVIVKGI